MRLVRSEYVWRFLLTSRKEQRSLEDLALKCGYRICELCMELECSQRYLHEVFSRDIGIPPKLWLRQERMAMAERLLREGLRPGEVGEKLGFAQGNGFRREFRQAYGIPPMDYARQLVIKA